MSLEHFDLQSLIEGIRNDPYRKALRGEIEGHRLVVRTGGRTLFALCECGWSATPDYCNRNGERRSRSAQFRDVVTPAHRHATLAATRPELFAPRPLAANG